MKRAAAFILDHVVLCGITFFYGILFFPLMILVFRVNDKTFMIAWGISLCILYWAYHFICDYWGKGRTIGKRATGIKVDSASGSISLRLAILHSFAKLFALLIFPATFLYYMIKKEMFYDDKLQITIIDEKQTYKEAYKPSNKQTSKKMNKQIHIKSNRRKYKRK